MAVTSVKKSPARSSSTSTRQKPRIRKTKKIGAKVTKVRIADAKGTKLRVAGPHLLLRLMDRQGYVSFDQVADIFRMSKKQIALTAGLSPHVVYKRVRLRSPRTQERVREMLEIVHRVSDWAGGKDQAMAWYRAQPIPAFGGRTAEALVKEGRAAAVRDYLDDIANGAFA